jgi:fermentation-respiration switch protein FrsA (DUF1100 family)
MRGVAALGAVVVAAYVGICAWLFFIQARLVYYPTRAIEATPAARGLLFEPVAFPAPDGVRLAGWFVPAAKARGTLLFCHGNAGNISHRLESIAIFHRLGLDVFIFDYRGYGESEGAPGEEGTYRDAEGAWRYLTERRGVAPERLVYFGRSLGGSVAAWLAARHAPRALIVESSFSSVPDFGAEVYPWLPVRWLARLRYDTAAYLAESAAPVLIVHSPQDEIIPFRHAERLYAAAREPKSLLRLRGDHNSGFLVSGEEYVNGLDAFLKQNGL